MLETVEHIQKDVLGIAEDKTHTLTVLLEVKKVVAQGGPLPLLQQPLDITCRTVSYVDAEHMNQLHRELYIGAYAVRALTEQGH